MLKMHKRMFVGMNYALCGAWTIDTGDPASRFIEWDRTRWGWKKVTCKKCLSHRKGRE